MLSLGKMQTVVTVLGNYGKKHNLKIDITGINEYAVFFTAGNKIRIKYHHESIIRNCHDIEVK